MRVEWFVVVIVVKRQFIGMLRHLLAQIVFFKQYFSIFCVSGNARLNSYNTILFINIRLCYPNFHIKKLRGTGNSTIEKKNTLFAFKLLSLYEPFVFTKY